MGLCIGKKKQYNIEEIKHVSLSEDSDADSIIEEVKHVRSLFEDSDADSNIEEVKHVADSNIEEIKHVRSISEDSDAGSNIEEVKHVRSLSEDSDAGSNFSTHVYAPKIFKDIDNNIYLGDKIIDNKFISKEPKDDSDCEWLPSPIHDPKL